MFARNEKVVYPGHGVAIISCVIEKKIAGKSLQFFELRFLNKDMTILVPTDNASAVGIRHLSSAEYINDVFKLLAQPAMAKQLDAAVSNWNNNWEIPTICYSLRNLPVTCLIKMYTILVIYCFNIP